MTTATDSTPEYVATAETVLLDSGSRSRLGAEDRIHARFGLGAKFSLAAVLLLLGVLAAALAVAAWRARQVAERSIHADLARVPALHDAYQSDLEGRLREVVRSLAAEPGTIALLDPSVSAATRHEFVASDAATIIGASTVFLFDAASRVLARGDRPEGEGLGQPFAGVPWVAGPLETMREASAVMRERDRLAVVAAAPVVSGSGLEARLDGVLAATFPLGPAQADALRGLTRGEVAYLVDRGRSGEPPALEVSVSTTGFAPGPFLQLFTTRPDAVAALVTRGETVGPFDLEIDGNRLVGIAVPVRGSTGDTYGAFVVTRALADEMAAYREIRATLVLVGLVGMLAAVPLSFAVGRRIARPLGQLTAGAAAIREGNLEVQLPEAGRDEVGVLARAFRALVGELREKRALEKLVADLQRPSGPAATAAGRVAATAGEAVARPGDTLAGRYHIRAPLGAGAMGLVFLARDLQLEEDVALKVLQPGAFAQAGTNAIQNLKSEIRLARRITHPNVVRVHDLGEADGGYFLTMEYVPGITLRQLVARQGTLALGPGLQVAKQMCRGLAAVHAAGILHLDIKPQNIMVLSNGVVKLMDFGIARIEQADPSVAADGTVVGTPSYMSPEQATGGTLDPRSDLYAVGAVLFELFTGAQPFTGPALEVIRQHVHQTPPRPGSLRADLPVELDRLIVACLAKEPARRPRSAQDLYAALMRVELPEL
jgi:serine/threonine-protein kinase